MNGPYYIISDNHFSMNLNNEEHERREKLFQVFNKIKSLNKGTLIIGGDFFDYWFEYTHEIPKGYNDILEALADLTKNNIDINSEVTYGNNKTINKIYKKYKKKFKFIKINFGQVLIFSPIILHGNIVNKTNTTRVALNCRFKSLLSPYDVFSKTHRNIPHFFRPLNTKVLTQIGFNFINAVEKKSEKKK